MKEMTSTDLPLLPWHWNPTVMIASPPGVGCFKAGVEYVHGGISVQELVVPRISVRTSAAAAQPRLASVKWVGMRCRVSVIDAIPGLKVDLRTRPADPEATRVEGRQAREVSPDGTVSIPVADPADEGMAAMIVLLSTDGRVLHSMPTEIGVNR